MTRTLLLIAYALSAILIPSALLNKLLPHPLWGQSHYLMVLWLGISFFGYLALFFCDLFMIKQLQRSLPPA